MFKNKSFLCVLIFLSLLIRISPSAHADPLREDFQTWMILNGTKTLDADKKYFFYFEAQPRIGDDSQQLERLLIRPAFGYNVTPKFSLWLGYAWTPTYMDSLYASDFRNENRIWQQAMYTHGIAESGFVIQHRLRQEQRFIDDAGGTANRTRYMIRASHPWEREGKSGLTAYNELFINLNTVERGPKEGLDRDRYFIGPYFIVDNARYEIGYLGERANHFRDGDRQINALLLSANFNF